MLVCSVRGLTLETILATWPDTQPSPVNGEKRDNQRNVTLRSKMRSALRRRLTNIVIKKKNMQSFIYIEERQQINHPNFHVHVCRNVLQCSCDKPFCCASSRCSPLQRRALQRRVAPFSDTTEAALVFLVFFSPSLFLVSDTLPSLSSRFFPPLLWCETQESPHLLLLLFSLRLFPRFPPQRDSLCRRVEAAARKHFMQIAVGVTSDEGEVIGEGVVPVLRLRAVGKKLITTSVEHEKCQKAAYWHDVGKIILLYENGHWVVICTKGIVV